MNNRRRHTYWLPVYSFCVTQVIAWGSLYYAFAVLLGPVSKAHNWNPAGMVGAFSLSLLVSGLAAYPAGRWIHRYGGRRMMGAGSVIAALAFATVAAAPSLLVFYLGWALAGLAMALSLYEAAFGVLAMIYAEDYRRAVTIVTLTGGFASTVFWPLTERLIAWFGWNETLWIYAALHLCVCLPLHAAGLPPHSPAPKPDPQTASPGSAGGRGGGLFSEPRYWFLTGSFTLNSIVFAVIAVHLIPLLQQDKGLTLREAAWLAATAGPLQVLGRILEFTVGRNWKSSQTGVLSIALTIPAMLGLALSSQSAMVMVSIGLYGISNGVMTIVRSLSIADLFGRENYARVSGAITAPGTIARAIGPILASSVLASAGGSYSAVLYLLAAISVVSVLLFWKANPTPPVP
jgi:predicted MFS family arabinose efflux permease